MTMESNEFPPIDSLILVVLLNNQRDFEIAKVLGWYRIPLRSAPRVISVDYLAFYQTSTFGADKWRINFIAPVRGHELTTRLELIKDEPNHPHAYQEYYKIQIGPLRRLPVPIMAQQWKRITFLYTTGSYLRKAKTINDLVIRNEERQLIWKTLQERASRKQSYNTNEPPDFDLDPGLLEKLLGINQIEANKNKS